MSYPPVVVEVLRAGRVESAHRAHIVVCGPDGQVQQAWGDPDKVILPRSSCKMIQALPLVESGAADAVGLTTERLALACASHEAEPIHNDAVKAWLGDMGLGEGDLMCGPQAPRARDLRHQLIRDGQQPCRIHNNCSGKHAGFLTLARHLGAPTEGYVGLDHPVQKAARAAHEELYGEDCDWIAIDGCSAPNFGTSLAGFGRALASFATAQDRNDTRSRAQRRLVEAMIAHPRLVAGSGRACTGLMEAAEGRAAIKTGAEGVFAVILPDTGQSIALKVEDGATRASDAAVAAMLVRMGVIAKDHPVLRNWLNAPLRNFDGLVVGEIRASDLLL